MDLRRPCGLRGDRCRAFTISEVLVATLLLGLVAAAVIWALTVVQRYSTTNRLYTQAQTLCQNQIDRILTNGPYNPTTGATPPELIAGQAPTPVQVSTAPGNPVSGTMTTEIKDAGLTIGGTDLKLKQATVTVAYTFRGQPFSIVMNTMRAPDQ
jgi:type II secretory pathway pseudopilin PulG